MKKKAMSVLLAMAVGATMVGCGNSDGNTTKKADDQQTEKQTNDELAEALKNVSKDYKLSMLYSDNATYPYKDNWLIWDIFKENTGATIDVQSVPETDFDTKRQMAIQSGEIPDIVTKTSSNSAGITNAADVLLPISDYLDYMPNFKAYIDKAGLMDQLDNYREADGKFYILPVKVGDKKTQYHEWMVRSDLVKDAGMETPKTLDDLYKVAKAIKEKNPKIVPILNRFGSGNLMAGIASGYDTIAGWTIGNGMDYKEKEDKWVFAPATQEWKDMIEYTHKLYADGLLDQEWTTMDTTVYEQKVVQGDTAIMYAWVGNQRIWNKQGKDINKNYNVDVIMPITGPSGKVAVESVSSWEQTWVLPKSLEKDTKHLAEVLHFVDWCYSDEAALLTTLGVEGKTCKKLDSGVYVYKDPTVNYTASEGLWNNCLDVRAYSESEPQTDEEKYDKEVMDKIAALDVIQSPDPVSPLTSKQKEDNSVTSTELVTYINTEMESFIKGDLTIEKDWDAFLDGCKEHGSDELQKQYDEAWAARKK